MVARVLKASRSSWIAFLLILPPTMILGHPRLLREVGPATTAVVLMVRHCFLCFHHGCLSASAKALMKSAVCCSDPMVGMSLNGSMLVYFLCMLGGVQPFQSEEGFNS